MEEFQEIMAKKLGVKLTQVELQGLLRRYKPELTQDGKLQTKIILDDIETLMEKARRERYRYNPSDEIDTKLSEKEVMELIKEKLTIKAANVRGANQYQKTFVIFGNNRSADLTKDQFKSALIFRLALKLHDYQVDRIFCKLDPENTGSVKIKKFVDALFLEKEEEDENENEDDENNHDKKVGEKKTYMDLGLSGHKKSTPGYLKYASKEKSTSFVDYSNTFQKLDPPHPSQYQEMTIDELEEKISDKIVEKVNSCQNMIQSIVKAFGDDRESRMSHKITMDQLKFTIWKKFQFLVKPSLIDTLYKRYDPEGKGYIVLAKLVDGIVRKHSKNEPLLEDYRSRNTGARDEKQLNALIIDFLTELRRKIKDVTNRDSRAPHYLLHSTNRMTIKQAKEFFAKKMDFQVNESLLTIVQKHYDSVGLIDMRKLIFSAMKFDNYGVLGKDQALIDGGAVTVDNIPSTLKHYRYSVQQIEELLYRKILGRMKTDQSLTSLYKLMNEDGQKQRIVTKRAVRNLLSRLDVIVNQDDFDTFFAKYDRGDGKVVVRSFLETIMSIEKSGINPFIPKLDKDQHVQANLVQALAIVTGHKRDVSYLEGPSDTRLRGEFVKKAEEEVDSVTSSIIDVDDNIVDVGINHSSYVSNQDDTSTVVSDAFTSSTVSAMSARIPSRPSTTVSTNSSNRVRRHYQASEVQNVYGKLSHFTLEDLKELFPSHQHPESNNHSHDLNLNNLNDTFNKYFSDENVVKQQQQHPRRPSTSMPSNGRKSRRNTSRKESHVDTGKPRSFAVDPYNPLLLQKYKVSSRNTSTSHEAYGLFLRGLKREEKLQQKMKDRYEKLLMEENNDERKKSEDVSVLNFSEIQSILQEGKFHSQTNSPRPSTCSNFSGSYNNSSGNSSNNRSRAWK